MEERPELLCALALFLTSAWAGAATCPFNIPVVSRGPSNDPSGFQWSAPILPLGEACLAAIEVDPTTKNAPASRRGPGAFRFAAGSA